MRRQRLLLRRALCGRALCGRGGALVWRRRRSGGGGGGGAHAGDQVLGGAWAVGQAEQVLALEAACGPPAGAWYDMRTQ
jgi:hypothetical protein